MTKKSPKTFDQAAWEREPWLRHELETDRQYAMFSQYLHGRDIAALAKRHPDPALIRSWCREYDWPRRAAVWDETRVHAISRAATGALGDFSVALDLGGELLTAWLERAVQAARWQPGDEVVKLNGEPVKLTAKDIIPLLKTLTDIHRLASGQSTQNVAVKVEGAGAGVVDLVDVPLDVLEILHEKLGDGES